MVSEQIDFVDAHMHLWDLSTGWYPALESASGIKSRSHDPVDFARIQDRNFLLEEYFDLARSAGNLNVTKLIHVTAASAPPAFPDETRFLQDLFDRTGYPNGIIGFTDFGRPVDEVDRELAEHSQSANFRGVRHNEGIDYTSAHVAQCFEVMQRRGLIYDVVADEEQLPNAAALAQRFDAMSFVLEHTGRPTRADDETFTAWRAGIAKLAACENAAVKISGLVKLIRPWTVESLRPWIEAAIEAFGTHRCMFATNFPPDWLYAGYGALMDAFLEITSGFSEAERHAMFVANAEHWYRI